MPLRVRHLDQYLDHREQLEFQLGEEEHVPALSLAGAFEAHHGTQFRPEAA